jgi:hypothetical protein
MLQDRVDEAKKLQGFIQIMDRDKTGKPCKMNVPGHEGRRYAVILRRQTGKLLAECLHSEASSNWPCEGSLKSICYHCLAAIIAAAADSGKKVVFFEEYAVAKNYSNFGGAVCIVEGWKSKKQLFMVVR